MVMKIYQHQTMHTIQDSFWFIFILNELMIYYFFIFSFIIPESSKYIRKIDENTKQ